MDFPETQKDFYKMFDTEEKCRDYLIQIRYEAGFVCPWCKKDKYWKKSNGILRCATCKKDISVTAGTIFKGRHLPLTVWFEAIWLMASQKTGISGLSASKLIGLKRPQTGWKLLQNIRKGMVRVGRDKLSGIVEIDEVFVGGVHKGKRGRASVGKALVLVAVEDRGKKGYGRIQMTVIKDVKSETLIPAILEMVETKSSVRTDGLPSYNSLTKYGFTHITTPKQSLEPGEDPTPLVHRIASLLKRWLLGTHQGGVHIKNLQPYLDEYVFRFNRRTSKSRGKLFYRLIQGMLKVKG